MTRLREPVGLINLGTLSSTNRANHRDPGCLSAIKPVWSFSFPDLIIRQDDAITDIVSCGGMFISDKNLHHRSVDSAFVAT